MVSAPVWLIIPSLKLGDYLSIQAHKSCSIFLIETICCVQCDPLLEPSHQDDSDEESQPVFIQNYLNFPDRHQILLLI